MSELLTLDEATSLLSRCGLDPERWVRNASIVYREGRAYVDRFSVEQYIVSSR